MMVKLNRLKLIWGLLVLVTFSFGVLNSEAGAQEFSALNLTDLDADKKLIQRVLTRQAEAWNQGDLERFMKTYWKSPQLTFSGGGKTTRGWDATLKRYQQNYAPPKAMGQLKFDELEITLLETKTAMVLGNWHLDLPDKTQRSGNFSLVLHKIDEQWTIIHDHSSTLEPPEDTATEKTQPAASPPEAPSTDGRDPAGIE